MIKKALFGLAVLVGKKFAGKLARKAAGKVAEKVFKRPPPVR
ncbi:MAG: hypothetical protein PHX38_13320 [Sulfuricella sp.]|nr:hypothetical protein [Sulfuricella sp.]